MDKGPTNILSCKNQSLNLKCSYFHFLGHFFWELVESVKTVWFKPILLYSVGKHKGFFLQLLKTLLNDIADPNCFETKQFLANIVWNYLKNINL
jgi:hypothetical protein